MEICEQISEAPLTTAESCVLVFPDPSRVARQPGWPLRNLLAAIAHLRRDWHRLRVLVLRLGAPADESFFLNVEWSSPTSANVDGEEDVNVPKCVGWERDANGALNYKNVELRAMFDPMKYVVGID